MTRQRLRIAILAVATAAAAVPVIAGRIDRGIANQAGAGETQVAAVERG